MAKRVPKVPANDDAAAIEVGLDRRLHAFDPAARKRIEEWAKKLVDLSRRNRLLYYRATKRTTLTFLRPSSDAIYGRLVDGGAFSFYRPPELPPLIPGRPRDATPLESELARRRPLERELVTSQRDPIEIDRSLEAIDRKARAEFEDRGTHVLYFAWNLLRWADPKTGEEQLSPLVLVPLELSRSSVTQPYQLRAADDGDPFLNPALRVKLEVDFNLHLPEIDLDELPPAAIEDQVRNALPSAWSTESHAAIGIFGFAKEAMYRDLVDHAEIVARHPIIKSMVRGQVTPEFAKSLDIAVPAESELDQSQDPGFSVIDADSSQRRAIEAANRGLSFVLYGPPGTGKSQTITNIIAEFIGRGKSVLFVSQKMAALEVVANRLEVAELRDLVLELHSAKASRGEVARALAQALDKHPQPNDSTAGTTFKALRTNRATLNGYVDALHVQRQPLGLSAFEVLAELTSLSNAPAIEGPPIDARTVTSQDASASARSAARLQDAWAPVEEGDNFPWWQFDAPVASAAERERVKDRLIRAREAVVTLESFDRELGRSLEWPMPDSQDERRAHAAVGEVIPHREAAPVEWLTTDDLAPYTELLTQSESRAAQHARVVEMLEGSYGPRWRELRPQTFTELSDKLATITALLGGAPNWDDLLAAAAGITAECDRLPEIIDEVLERLGAVDRAVGIASTASRADGRRALEIARISQSRNRPAGIWLSRARLADARDFLAAHGSTYVEEQRDSANLRERYDEGVMSLDLDPLMERMRRWHGHWWNRLRPQHRADRSAIMATTRSRTLLPSVLDDLELARKIRDTRAKLDSLDKDARVSLGPYARGLNTDAAAAGQAIAHAEHLMLLPSEVVDWRLLAAVATAEAPYDPNIERHAEGLESALARVEESVQTVIAFAATDRRDELLDWERLRTTEWNQTFLATLRGLVRLHDDTAKWGEADSMARTVEIAQVRQEIDELESALVTQAPVLRAALRAHFQGFATDWETLKKAAIWAAQVRKRYGSELPDSVARDLMSGTLDPLPWEGHARSIGALDSEAQAVASLFADSAATAIAATLTGSAAEAKAWLDTRLGRIDDLSTWHSYHAARADLEDSGWGGFVDMAVERRTDRRDLAPAIRRAWLESWFASLGSTEPLLGGFSRAEHERTVASFRREDMSLVQLGRERVLREYAEHKPRPATVQGGEQATVRKEAVKRRRHLPVRALLESLPTLLPKIKPCLMMSPLSVSHFLAPTATFDLVVFDEASQVPPEDAVNCIYRGRQLIVAGDPKQLPPTDFFQLSAISEQEGDFEEDIDDFESVLDLCRGMGLPPHSLEWHYRSRDDSLIAFSNHFIYDGDLVTFPAPYQHSDDLGVSFEYVSDAVFDRGGSASNPIEARRVVDVAVAHWARHPDQSIGVVAFSVAQQTAVQDELARRVRIQPELERLLGAGRLDAFFVKNLETVQGDERDVIVFTIGYGRDSQGRIFNNFGALNRPGGARRLNVAVTRARRRVVVVSSIRAGDLQLPEATVQAGSLPPGAALLKAYLDYAERGVLPEVATSVRGDDMGPLELDVARVIRDLGYDVVERVGTSKYRVDLGVVSKSQPGRFTLGVECDGAMYRQAQTARDRDRLRDSVLKGLDWTVHRVWAPGWYFRRNEEIKRLHDAIESSERRLVRGGGNEESRGEAFLPRPARPVVEVREVRVEGPEDAVELGWATYYTVSTIKAYPRGWEFHDPSRRTQHAERVIALAGAEGPMHSRYIANRLTRAFGLGRAGSRIWEAVVTAIAVAANSGAVRRRGEFVWPAEDELPKVRVPAPGNDETDRPIDHIPPEELELALLRIAETAGTIDRATLRVAVSRIFGFERTGGKIDNALEVRLNALLHEKRLSVSAGAVVLGPKAALLRIQPATSANEFPDGSWVRHPRLGVGRVVRTKETVVTILINDEEKQIETKLIQLVPVPRPG